MVVLAFQEKKQKQDEAYSPLQHLSPYRQPLTTVTNTAITSDAMSHVSWNCPIHRTFDHRHLTTVTNNAVTSDAMSHVSWNCPVHRTFDHQPLTMVTNATVTSDALSHVSWNWFLEHLITSLSPWSPMSVLLSPGMPCLMWVKTVQFIEHLITSLSPQSPTVNVTVTRDAMSPVSWNCLVHRTFDHQPLTTVTNCQHCCHQWCNVSCELKLSGS